MKDLMKAGVDVYSSRGTFETMGLSGHRAHHVKALQQFIVGEWTILPFETEHDCPEPLGFLLANPKGDKLLFLTDSAYCKPTFKGLTHIMCECNFSNDILARRVASGAVSVPMKNRLIQSHFSLDRVKDFLKANDLSRLQEIHLLHLSDGNSNAVQFKAEIQALTGLPVYVA